MRTEEINYENKGSAFKIEKKHIGQLYMQDNKNGSFHESKKNTIRVHGLEMMKRVQRANFDFKIKTRHKKVECKGKEYHDKRNKGEW